MDTPTPVVSPNINTNKIKPRTQLLLIGLPLLLILLAIGGYFYITKYKNSTTVDKLVGKQIPDVEPWGYADDTLSVKPRIPSESELDALYKKFLDTIKARDYESFKKVASAERIWHTENPKKYVGDSPEGDPIFERTTNLTGLDNFQKYAPYAFSFNGPKYEDIVISNSREGAFLERRNLILVDPSTNNKEHIIVTGWRYQVDLGYVLKPGLPNSGSGVVTFVYDNGSWKYQVEVWNIEPHKTPINVGDTNPVSTLISYDKSGNCVPQIANISPGTTVGWENIQGRIYTIPVSSDQWDSGYLYNDNFYKTFPGKGTYNYLIQRPPNEPDFAKVCSINVK